MPVSEKSTWDSQTTPAHPYIPLPNPTHPFTPQNYPKLQVHIVPSGASISVLLDAVNAGTCGGAISTNVHLEYGIGLGDVNGRFCNLSATGANLGVGFYAIPFNLATDDVVIDAATDITSATITVRGRPPPRLP